MAGITDSAMRQMCRLYGADVVYSEMASATALFHKPEKTLKLLKFDKAERPYVVQLFGNDPEHFAKATEIITKTVKPDGIDINFGCPAKKVFGHGSGCALMPQKELARKIILAVCENTTFPVSLKIRAGLKNLTALEFIENIKDLPFTAIMVHGRTYEGSFSGEVDFKVAEEIKKIIPKKIVLANGGITTPVQAAKIMEDYPLLDGLGIARGVLGKPYLFAQIKELLQNPSLLDKERCPKGTERYDFNKIKKISIRHAEIIYKEKGVLGMLEIRKHLVWYFKGFPGAAELRKKLVQVKSVKEIKNILK
ncbi:MAG TPA: tRNA-dihydrouridine synthase [Patescibacteria group bacterium]